MILTVFFCALAMAAITCPLSRIRLSIAPQLGQVHQGLERHTYFEVSAGGPHSQALHDLLAGSGLPLMVLAQQRSFRRVSAHQLANWPIVFSPVYRHIPPSKSGDSEPSA